MHNFIQKALVSNNFVFHLQPIYARNGSVFMYESLVRLQLENKNILSPSHFFSHIKQDDKFGIILLQSLKNACEELKRNNEVRISINMSYRDIENSFISDAFLELLKNYEKELLSRLVIEFIETYDIGNINTVIWFCKEIKKHGIEISIDDFGIKNSNFYIISLISFDYLKLDGHFVKNFKNEKNQIIIAMIIDLCKKLKIELIAEHIESEDDYSSLKHAGVDYFQGFYLGEPK
ncbi:EAL domain-containing protein [Sulfurimonas indica]|uniref:EAL domain-containing protein n=1 Tax=Sulfurimonas TaxID=202746 RepID=UPI0012659CC8|nr:EAL domain-containing protein [Sulfurimonas indica]